MLGFIIIAHAPLASALKAVAAHAFPECVQTLEVLDVPADMPPEEIEARLESAGLLPARHKIPRSTMNRLLSAEPFRNRVGFSTNSSAWLRIPWVTMVPT